MILAELKKKIDELSKQEAPNTPVKIWLWNGDSPDVGHVHIGIYADGTRTIGIHEA